MNTRLAAITFISLCQEVKHAVTKTAFDKATVKAQWYSKAIQDLTGVHIWANIVREADLEVGDDETPVCAGIPLLFNRKNQQP